MNFDRYVRQYDQDLEKGIRLSGEGKHFFARERLIAVHEHFARSGFAPLRMIEFGCGIGTNIGIIRELWPATEIIGLDISEESLTAAEAQHRSTGARFMTPDTFRQAGEEPGDWVFCTGVVHHVPVAEREAVLRFIRDLLTPAGSLTVFENNPFNPGARLVMRLIPFDRDAVMVNPYRLESTLAGLGY